MTSCYYFIDTETTGLDYRRNSIIEFGGIKVCEGLIAKEIDIKIKPDESKEIDPKALQVNGYSKSKWRDANTQEEAAYLIASFFDEPGLLVGHNIWFDRQFLCSILNSEQIQSVPFRRICTRDLSVSLLSQYGLQSFTLQSVCDFLGLVNHRPHSAYSDAYACYEICKILNPFDPYARFLVHQWLGLHGPGPLPHEIEILL